MSIFNRRSFLKFVAGLPLAKYLATDEAHAHGAVDFNLPTHSSEVPDFKLKADAHTFLVGWLKKDEWTMGNGQCHICCGLSPHGNLWGSDRGPLGHEHDCSLAKSLKILGQKPDYV